MEQRFSLGYIIEKDKFIWISTQKTEDKSELRNKIYVGSKLGRRIRGCNHESYPKLLQPRWRVPIRDRHGWGPATF